MFPLLVLLPLPPHPLSPETRCVCLRFLPRSRSHPHPLIPFHRKRGVRALAVGATVTARESTDSPSRTELSNRLSRLEIPLFDHVSELRCSTVHRKRGVSVLRGCDRSVHLGCDNSVYSMRLSPRYRLRAVARGRNIVPLPSPETWCVTAMLNLVVTTTVSSAFVLSAVPVLFETRLFGVVLFHRKRGVCDLECLSRSESTLPVFPRRYLCSAQ